MFSMMPEEVKKPLSTKDVVGLYGGARHGFLHVEVSESPYHDERFLLRQQRVYVYFF